MGSLWAQWTRTSISSDSYRSLDETRHAGRGSSNSYGIINPSDLDLISRGDGKETSSKVDPRFDGLKKKDLYTS